MSLGRSGSEGDLAEPALDAAHDVRQGFTLGAADLGAEEVLQVALLGDERNQRQRPGGVGRLDELVELGALGVDEGVVADLGGEPEDQLVEEEHQRVVPEGPWRAG
ncbi:hypothetical protein [Micromonospora sp. NPDC050200]|uniref:hypothetical protein n=1 Tax=Micromonospora sp. NPDC050200 TaxID=3155664 RepID=UPI0033C0F948